MLFNKGSILLDKTCNSVQKSLEHYKVYFGPIQNSPRTVLDPVEEQKNRTEWLLNDLTLKRLISQ